MNLKNAPPEQSERRRPENGGQSLYSSAVAVLSALLLVATGCATTAQKEFATEKLLVAAGFTYKTAQSSQEKEKLRKLPQNRLIRHETRGKPVYAYASAEGCNCVYVGEETAYERYLELQREAKLNRQMQKGAASEASVFSTDQDWASDLDDLASGIIPGY